jgi:hypothetical protein
MSLPPLTCLLLLDVHRGFDLPKYIASEERPSVNGVKEGKPYRPKIPEREVYIQHSRPLVGVDVNGILLYIVLPNFLSRAAHVSDFNLSFKCSRT